MTLATSAAVRSGPARIARRLSPIGDRGSATVWVALGAALVLAATSAVLAGGAAVVERHRAASAADLAALAAAQAHLDGSGSPCAVASDVAAANGSRLLSCAAAGGTVEVVIARARRPGGWSFLPPARGRARAGPGEPGQG